MHLFMCRGMCTYMLVLCSAEAPDHDHTRTRLDRAATTISHQPHGHVVAVLSHDTPQPLLQARWPNCPCYDHIHIYLVDS